VRHKTLLRGSLNSCFIPHHTCSVAYSQAHTLRVRKRCDLLPWRVLLVAFLRRLRVLPNTRGHHSIEVLFILLSFPEWGLLPVSPCRFNRFARNQNDNPE